MKQKKFTKFDFKKFHPSGSLSLRLKTVGDLMIKGKRLPLINENNNMTSALNTINKKRLGVLIVRKNNNDTVGIITDGDLKRIAQKYDKIQNLVLKKVMKKNPLSVEKDTLAATALSIMNTRKITSLCVHNNKNIKRTIGLIHMHDILKSNIN